MKKIKIFGILTILVLALDIAFSMGDFINEATDGFTDGFKDSFESKGFGSMCRLNVEPTTAPADSLFNTLANKQIAYQTTEIRTYAEPPVWVFLLAPFIFIVGIAYLIGFVCLIKLLIAVTRKNVFTQQNVRSLRLFVYSQGILMSMARLQYYMIGYGATQQIEMQGYKVVGGVGLETDWPMIMISILLAEIFAVGVKIKEEQELTI